ncbi:MAG: NAD(P)H-quinone oxidoreductase [Acidocella sp. 20-57-95]|nr:MAG: NAD(P)H-quinone oxidoreductase [Acidocella sp. 20-57-95]OYV62064.1 MAG: NAD(P)H-quinone oxidoreductase [Acidocella sp. 21-58-7]HQT65409.1 NAD(P)H-quinone oxidoreductase [Acidocella sp.]HQU04089.1 NAD(P)H-quinone oxidoreductase [Acidocella sp.]
MNSPLPATMRFINLPSPGGPEAMRLGQTNRPEPKSDEVLIRVQAAGVNRPDIQQRKGAYPPPPNASPILGLEAAGEVVARGSAVTMYDLGDRVTALCNGGAYAEYVAVPATQCLPWPRGYSAIQAAALPETYFTVWANLFDIGALQPEDSLLVHGGTSGIGITAIQFAVAQGSKVFATAGSDEKCAVITRLGATAINYRTKDFVPVIKEATAHGVNVVLDMVGAPYTAQNLAVLAPRGRLVQIAFMNGAVAENLNLLPIMVKRLTVTGSTMRPRTTIEKAAIAHSLLETIWPQLEAGLYAPIIHATFPLAEAAAAHTLMESSTHIGKIILTL